MFNLILSEEYRLKAERIRDYYDFLFSVSVIKRPRVSISSVLREAIDRGLEQIEHEMELRRNASK